MENLPLEFLIQVYTYNKTPISLILVNKRIYKLFMSPLAKAKWALGTFGKTHALFHAIRLGKTFITVDVIKALLKLKANFSRYLVQICLAERSTQQTKCNFLYPKISWFSEMSLEAYLTLINEGTFRFGTNVYLNTNDAKMFSFLSGQLLPDDQASILIKKNLKEIEDLIVNKEFTPFPPRPKVSNDEKNISARDDSEFHIKKEFDNLETSFIKDEQVKSSNKNNSNDNQHLFVYDFKKETFTDMLKNYISSCIKKPTDDGLTLKNPGKWFRELEKEYNNTSKATTSSDNFINLFNMIWKRINEETSLLNLSEK
nr:10622_t:CDS:2 [Entrophospora candida]